MAESYPLRTWGIMRGSGRLRGFSSGAFFIIAIVKFPTAPMTCHGTFIQDARPRSLTAGNESGRPVRDDFLDASNTA